MQGSTNVTLVVGPRGSGKTTFTTAVMRFKQYLQRGYVLCLTPEVWNTWTNYFPASYIYQVFGPEFERKEQEINEIQESVHLDIKSQKRNAEREGERLAKEEERRDWERCVVNFANKAKLEKWTLEKTKINKSIMEEQWGKELKRRETIRVAAYDKMYEDLIRPHIIISPFDDLGFDTKAMSSPTINIACMNGRHYLKELYYLCQHFMQFSPKNRDAVDWLMVSPNVSSANLKRLCEHYMPGGMSPKELVPILNMFAKNKWWLCIDRRSKSRNPHEFLLRYKVEREIVSESYIGDDLYKYVHRMCFDPERVAEERSRAKRYFASLLANKKGGDPAEKSDESEEKEKNGQNQLSMLYADFGPPEEAKLMQKYLAKEISKKSFKPVNLIEFQ